MDCAAVSVSVGGFPFGGVAAANSLLHASAFNLVAQAHSRSASVAKFAILRLLLLFSGSDTVAPQPPDSRSTKLGTLPAAILGPREWPFIAEPLTNCACVHTDATVVISLMTTLAGGVFPTTASSATAGLSPLPLLTAAS